MPSPMHLVYKKVWQNFGEKCETHLLTVTNLFLVARPLLFVVVAAQQA